MTLHCFGDSFTYGENFEKFLGEREKHTYPVKLAKKLNVNYVNHAIPGASTWRIARLVSQTQFNENDLVTIAWGFSDRFEFCASDLEVEQNINVYDGSSDNLIWRNDVVENHKSVYCRRFFPQMIFPESKNSPEVKTFATLAYKNFYNKQWFQDMFLVMFCSTMHILQKSKVKFLMFNTVGRPYQNSNSIFEIKEYLLGYQNNLTAFIRNDDNVGYWSAKEHDKVTDFLYNSFKTTYNI